MKRKSHTYRKLLLRGVRSTMARFLAILAIFAVGVGFLGGLMATTPDMQYTANKYYRDTNTFDLYLKGTLGITDDDVAAVRDLDYVESATPAYVTDLTLENDNGTYVTRVYGLDISQEDLVNNFVLTSGRLPEKAGECLICTPNTYSNSHDVGESYYISQENSNYDDLCDEFAVSDFEAVGTIDLPYYLSIESETTSVGTGSIALVMYVLPETYDMEVYTDIYLTLTGAKELDTFDDEYQTFVDDYADRLEDFASQRCQVRYDEVTGEAQGEIDDGWDEYNSAKADADKELADARAELDDGWEKLNSAKEDAEAARAEIADGESEIAAAQTELNNSIASAQAELDAKIQQALTEQTAAAHAQVDEALAPYQAEIDANLAQLEAGKDYMTDEEYAAAMAQIDSSQAALDAQRAEQYAAADEKVEQAIEQERYTGQEQIDSARVTGQAHITASQAQLDAAREELSVGEAEIAANEEELNSGEEEYAKSKADAEAELEDARAELEDAENELADVEFPEWYIFDRSDTTSYTSYKSNSEKIAAIAKVFPLFLFFVAALVALTTMTRLVEEERVQIGTLKALGYSDGAILGYYLGYSALACVAGSIFGIAIGFKTLPGVIANAYSMMFTLPKTLMPFRFEYASVIVPIALICSLGATLGACLSQLREKPSTLMLPRAPKAGKRIMLERIKLLWKRMSFTHKVTARNIFRYKKRFYMTVCGIAGCTALLVCAFGLRDSIHDIVELQFDEIYNYNYTAYLKDGNSLETDPIIQRVLSDEGGDENVIELHSESGKIIASGGEHSATMLIPRDTDRIGEFITLRERKTHNGIEFNDNSVVIAEKLCETMGIKVGDTITLRDADGRSGEVTVTGICENYVTGYVYVSKAVYERIFGEISEYKVLWGKISDFSETGRSNFSGALLKSDNVLAVSFLQTVRESFENTVKSIDYIVIVLIIAAGVLAVIVLYNLTNINICERKKELATIKVLGFREGEVASYIYRETNILCLIGIVIGLVLGIWLHHFVVITAEIDVIMFGRSIYAMSYVYAAAVTIVFMALVDLIMLKKLGGIDMVESMKANE